MKHLFLTAVLAVFCGTAFSQTTATPDRAQEVKHACPMPDMKAVHQLDLPAEQLVRVREITAECERACAQAKAETGEMDREAMARYQEQIREVLTPEQYARYQELPASKEKH